MTSVDLNRRAWRQQNIYSERTYPCDRHVCWFSANGGNLRDIMKIRTSLGDRQL